MKVYRVKPGARIQLAAFDTRGEKELTVGKEQAAAELEAVREDIRRLQGMLYAERRHRLLIVLQGVDGSGKDGTVRHVFHGMDPHGLRVVSFKSPAAHELARDYLWRIHREVPARGEITVFNRSHYEDLVTVRVKSLAPAAVWQRRPEHIVNFERMLTDEGCTILKFFLHISRDEQRQRLQSRLESPDKHWKFHPDDIADSRRFPEILAAYSDAISATTTPEAPWFIVPADRKWYRNLVIASTVREALQRMELKFPPPAWDLSGMVIP